MSQILEQIEKPKEIQKQQVLLSDIFLNATEEQATCTFVSTNSKGEKSYCALGLVSLYAGTIS